METIKLAGTILGGLGLFLLAIGMMTDGLKHAAGSSLRALLSKWSSTALRGILSGFFMTAVVQSSSAITVASLGFVNAGLISMRQALGILYGANIGTTMTGWLVALIGFKLNIQAFALPMIGVGMALKLFKPRDQLASFGMALVGFGLFFVGIDVLKTAFEGVVQAFDISRFTVEGPRGVLICLVIGFAMTVLTQSSSASIALTITAASSNMLGLYAAAGMVIGANIGTTSTAILAAFGATSNAKRLAAAQVIFNVATGIAALSILPILFYGINSSTTFFHIQTDVAVLLAIFHTVFNLLGVALIYPHNDWLVRFLNQRFISWEEQQSHLRYLDKTISETPVLAVNALILELLSIADKTLAAVDHVELKHQGAQGPFNHEIRILKSLSAQVSQFIVNIEKSAMNEETTQALSVLMRVDQYFLTCIVALEELVAEFNRREHLSATDLELELEDYFALLKHFMRGVRATYRDIDKEYAELISDLSTEHDLLKATLIDAATQSKISIETMSESIDHIADGLHIAKQWLKAFIRLSALESELAHYDVADLPTEKTLTKPGSND